MSFLINWDLLADGAEAEGLRDFLNARFSTTTRPSFLGPLKVTELDFGDVPPEIAVVDICDPDPEFYLPDDPKIWRPSTPPAAPTVAGLEIDALSGSATLVQRDEDGVFEDPSWSDWRNADDGERDDESESYFNRSHHPSTALARGELLRRRGRPQARGDVYDAENEAEERDFAALARGRNMSSDDFQELAQKEEDERRDMPAESPRLPQRSDHEIAAEYAETMRRPSDAQVEFEIVYKGNMRLAIQTELIVNQPTPAFMVLPLLLTLTGFHFTASALVSYLGDRINFCFKESDAGTTILQDVSIDSEVGDGRKQGVLKNVGRIERFIVEQLRKVIQDFLVFPNHHSLKLLQDPVHSDENDFGDDRSEDFDDGLSYDPPL
ncbi:Mitochondrial distribution and morphology protein 12 [Geranomyces michiganensis]|nr:Mitochondrial distribution and morphology protein 12 [Geranomyces michiganensis]